MAGRRESNQSVEDPDEEEPDLRIYVVDLLSSASAVLLVGLFLFSISGVWPPLVAIESPSMEPHIDTGDLVFVMDADRFPGPGHHEGTGVVTAAAGERTGYVTFQAPGDVVVYQPDGRENATPIIHRAMFWVEEDENWYERADQEFVADASSCRELTGCPAEYAGFVTKGDNNERYDQTTGISGVVKPEWVIGTAELRVPELGRIRLQTGRVAAANDTGGRAGNAPVSTRTVAAG